MPAKRIHFLGITGHTMRGIALAAAELGYTVTGTDPGGKPPGSDWLDKRGITWWRESDAAHLDDVDMLVVSGATLPNDLELLTAQKNAIPVVSYPEFIRTLIADKRRIVVAGTHGKTTTTSLITWLFESAGQHPDYLIGIEPRNFDTSVRLSESPIVILEGDEYKASVLDERSKFSFYDPHVLVATSLEMDHPDLFTSLADIRGRFETLVEGMPADGRIVYWQDAPELMKVMKQATPPTESYGERGAWKADHVQYTASGLSFDLYRHDAYVDHFRIGLYGRHNIENATAALAVAIGEGLDVEQLQHGCETFLGASRRFEIVSKPHADVTVVDDYAHHPTEIAATISAAKLHFGGRVIAVVRPHTYSRTKELLREYRSAMHEADRGFVTDIEAAREADQAQTVSGKDIVTDNGKHLAYEPDRAALAKRIVAAAKPGDVVLCMTVSGYENLAEDVATRLQSTAKS